MTNCIKCGTPLEPAARFCTACGAECGTEQPKALLCKQCGQEMEPDARFCDACGADNSPAAGQPEQAPATQPEQAHAQKPTAKDEAIKYIGGLVEKYGAMPKGCSFPAKDNIELFYSLPNDGLIPADEYPLFIDDSNLNCLTNRAVYSFSLKKNIEFTIPWKTITAVSKEKSLIGGSVVFEFQDGGKGGAKKLFCLSKAVMEYVFNLSNQMRQDLGQH